MAWTNGVGPQGWGAPAAEGQGEGWRAQARTAAEEREQWLSQARASVGRQGRFNRGDWDPQQEQDYGLPPEPGSAEHMQQFFRMVQQRAPVPPPGPLAPCAQPAPGEQALRSLLSLQAMLQDLQGTPPLTQQLASASPGLLPPHAVQGRPLGLDGQVGGAFGAPVPPREPVAALPAADLADPTIRPLGSELVCVPLSKVEQLCPLLRLDDSRPSGNPSWHVPGDGNIWRMRRLREELSAEELRTLWETSRGGRGASKARGRCSRLIGEARKHSGSEFSHLESYQWLMKSLWNLEGRSVDVWDNSISRCRRILGGQPGHSFDLLAPEDVAMVLAAWLYCPARRPTVNEWFASAEAHTLFTLVQRHRNGELPMASLTQEPYFMHGSSRTATVFRSAMTLLRRCLAEHIDGKRLLALLEGPDWLRSIMEPLELTPSCSFGNFVKVRARLRRLHAAKSELAPAAHPSG